MKHNKILYILLLFFTSTVTAQISISDDRVVVRNEEKVNSESLEYSPVFYKEGIIFVTTQHDNLKGTATDTKIDKNIMSLYQSMRNDEGLLSEPELFTADLFERVHEGPVTFNQTGQIIYFTRNVLDKKDKASDGRRKLLIYEAKQEGEKWGEINELSFNNKECNTMHPSISADENVLYFSSDRPGGMGGMDLYKVEKQEDDSWSEPINLGETINTGGNEVFPFIHADGTLYFASDNHFSLGGLDIYLSKETNGNWQTPKNLEAPFNTVSDDFGIVIDRDNRNGYFSSNRKAGAGGDDIYSFEYFGDLKNENELVEKEMVDEGLKITDAEGNPIEGVNISYLDLNDVLINQSEVGEDGNKVIRLESNRENDGYTLRIGENENLEQKGTTDASGNMGISVDKNGNYLLKIEKEGYIPKQIVVSPDTDWSTLDFTLQRSTNCADVKGFVLVEGTSIGQANTKIIVTDTESLKEEIFYTDTNGNYKYCLPCNRIFSMYADKNGTFTASKIINTKGENCSENSILAQNLFFNSQPSPLVEGQVIELPNIYFNFNDASLRRDAKKDLDAVLALLNSSPEMAIELASHTDSRGGRRYNNQLSKRRSESVRQWLIKKGINSSRLAAIGLGEEKIRNGCTSGIVCSEEEHQFNRRTEFRVVSKSNPFLGMNSGAFSDRKKTESRLELNTSPQKSFSSDDEKEEESEERITGYKIISIKQETSRSPFSVIAGTFGKENNAAKRLKELRLLGYDNSKIIISENGMYVVFVDTFERRHNAEVLAKKLKTKEGMSTSIKVN